MPVSPPPRPRGRGAWRAMGQLVALLSAAALLTAVGLLGPGNSSTRARPARVVAAGAAPFLRTGNESSCYTNITLSELPRNSNSTSGDGNATDVECADIARYTDRCNFVTCTHECIKKGDAPAPARARALFLPSLPHLPLASPSPTALALLPWSRPVQHTKITSAAPQ